MKYAHFNLFILFNITPTHIHCKFKSVYHKVSSQHGLQFYTTSLTSALSSCWGDTAELHQCRSNFETYNENQEKVKVFLLLKQIKPEARFNRFFFLLVRKNISPVRITFKSAQLYIKGGTKPVIYFFAESSLEWMCL